MKINNMLVWQHLDKDREVFYLTYNSIALAVLVVRDKYCFGYTAEIFYGKDNKPYRDSFEVLAKSLEERTIKYLNAILNQTIDFVVDRGDMIEYAEKNTLYPCSCGGMPEYTEDMKCNTYMKCPKCGYSVHTGTINNTSWKKCIVIWNQNRKWTFVDE